LKRNDENLIKKKYKLSSVCSGFQALLIAIRNTLKVINNKNCISNSLVISTRSLAVIKGLRDFNSTNDLICEIFETMHEMKSSFVFKLNYCQERDQQRDVESLAREAAISHQSFSYDLMPYNSMKKLIREKQNILWDQRWQSSQTGRQTKKFFETINDRKVVKKHFRPDFYTSQAITSHGNTNEYLNRFGIKNNKSCEKCGEDVDSTDHRIFECQAYDMERKELIERIEEEGYQWPVAHKILINKDNFKNFSKFCKNILHN
jgi:hypothetical protein